MKNFVQGAFILLFIIALPLALKYISMNDKQVIFPAIQGISMLYLMAFAVYSVIHFALKSIIKKSIPSIFINTGLAVTVIGFLNMIMHWPGVVLLLVNGLVVTILGFIILFLQKDKSSE